MFAGILGDYVKVFQKSSPRDFLRDRSPRFSEGFPTALSKELLRKDRKVEKGEEGEGGGEEEEGATGENKDHSQRFSEKMFSAILVFV